MSTIDVYTDGACSGNPGPGGWGWYAPALANTNEKSRGQGAEVKTTNNRMELRAVIDAIDSLSGDLRIHSDSKYIVDCMNKGCGRSGRSMVGKLLKETPLKIKTSGSF